MKPDIYESRIYTMKVFKVRMYASAGGGFGVRGTKEINVMGRKTDARKSKIYCTQER